MFDAPADSTARGTRSHRDRPERLRGRAAPRFAALNFATGGGPRTSRRPRPALVLVCWRPSRRRIVFTDEDYAELLALYLGDGHIVRTGRSDRFRLFLDTRYSQIISDARSLLQRCFPEGSVGLTRSAEGTTTILSLYCTHLACVFPQHGAGRKHHRRIELEEWQRTIVERQPWPFLRGLIRSDGCVFVDRTVPYEYVSYDFKNHSADILGLFTDACDLVGMEYRAYSRHVRIYRRASVALMLEHVGLKA